MKHMIELRNVHKNYQLGDYVLHVLKGINLRIREGERLAILGKSGSGKSTLLNMVGVLDNPTRGDVFIDGKNVSQMTENQLARLRGKKIGFVFQFFHLIPSMNVLQNVLLPMTFFGKKDVNKAKKILRLVGLGHRIEYMPRQLSGGERQRVAIARALINDPEIVLADEPTGNLDSKSGKQVLDTLLKINKQNNITLVIITHDVSITKKMNRIVYMKDGKIVKERCKK